MTRIIGFILLAPLLGYAQDNPGAYMSSLTENYKQINKDTWDYIRQASKGRNAGKVERRRQELAQTLKKSKYEVSKTASYKGDKALRDAYEQYLALSYYVINDNYKKIVDLEQISEESYDAMEEYLLLKERVNERMDSAYQNLRKIQNEFASKHNVNIVEGESRLSKKLSNASRVNKYDNKVFLIYFKSSWYEAQMIKAQNEGKVGDMEQFRQTLEIVSKEGLEELQKLNSFEGDNSLKTACTSMLEFYHGEAVRYAPKQVAFYQAKEKMETISKNFNAKSNKERTKKDVDDYNSAVADYNNSINSFNETNEYLNKYRTKRTNNYNKVRQDFFNKYM